MRRLVLLVLVGAALIALLKMFDTALPSQVSDLLGTGEADRDRDRDRVTVVRVTDGDTLGVRLPDGSEENVRILGIDTPEVREPVECGGGEASERMLALVPVGTTVVLVSDPTQGDRDRYDRLLRYVVRSGDDVGLAQLTSGHARVFIFRDDPFERAETYQRAERRASQDDRGSWSRCWR